MKEQLNNSTTQQFRKFIFFFFLSLILSNTTILSQEICGTDSDVPNLDFTSLYRKANAKSSDGGMLCLNVYFHIVQDNNGNNGLPHYETNLIIENLNEVFNPHNISFVKVGHDFIKSDAYLDLDKSEMGGLFSEKNKNNAINYYIVKTAFAKGSSGDTPDNDLFVTQDASRNRTSAHEMGHCLNLFHTHEGYGLPNNEYHCEEIDPDANDEGGNGDRCGDLVVDTPADSKLNEGLVDSSCNYLGTDGLNPDTNNIMSYTSDYCKTHFTNGQGVRMRDAIESVPLLQAVLTCSCTETTIFGDRAICSSGNYTYEIPCVAPNDNITWTTSSNLQIISNTTKSIVVKAINSSINEIGFVKVQVNNEPPVQKDLWIGKPKVDLELTPYSNFIELELKGVNSNRDDQEITYIEWKKLSGNGIMNSAINSVYNIAHGVGANWSVYAKITVVNNCGTTYLYKDITPPASGCGESYNVEKIDKNQYTTKLIIDPCLSAKTQSSSKDENKTVSNEEFIKAELLDIYGKTVRKYNANSFNVNGLKTGIYIFKIQLAKAVITTKIYIN